MRAAQTGADADDILAVADRAIAVWSCVDVALAPIIGRRGVAALYRRSLQLTSAGHSCLSALLVGERLPGDYASLQGVLAGQPAAAATAAHDALLRTFHDLLVKLIGSSLTDQLLQSVPGLSPGAPSSGATAEQDT